MVDYVTRAEWGARAPEGRRLLNVNEVENAAIHWPGSSAIISATGDAGFRRTCSALRGWQAYHMDGRGWSDIAYCVAVDNVGRAYTLRGIPVQSGANGNQDVNERFGAILVILGPGEAPSVAMKRTVSAVMVDYRARFPRIPRRPTWHGAIRPTGGTDCPGPLTIANIKAGEFDAGIITPPPVKDWFDMATLAELEFVVRKVVNELVPPLVATELNKQDVDLWINGTGKSQVIDPIKRIEAKTDGLAKATTDAVMNTQLPNVLAPVDPATGLLPKIAVSSVLTYAPTRVVEAIDIAESTEE